MNVAARSTSVAARMSLVRRSWQSALTSLADETGATAVEYGLIAALIALALIGSLVHLRDSILGLPMQSLIDAFVNALP